MRMIWMESPSVPLLKLVDLPAVAAVAERRASCRVIDNTFASPVLPWRFLRGVLTSSSIPPPST